MESRCFGKKQQHRDIIFLRNFYGWLKE